MFVLVEGATSDLERSLEETSLCLGCCRDVPQSSPTRIAGIADQRSSDGNEWSGNGYVNPSRYAGGFQWESVKPMTNKRNPKEVRARAVRLVVEPLPEHGSQWSTVASVAEKNGVRLDFMQPGHDEILPLVGFTRYSRDVAISIF